MAKLDTVINSEDLPTDAFAPLPPGEYQGLISASKFQPTSKGDGQMMVLTVEIQGEEGQGKKITEYLTLQHPNETTERIAKTRLGQIMAAVGKTSIKDTDELHDKIFLVDLIVNPAQEYVDKKTGIKKPGSPQNAIAKYSPYGSSVKAPSKTSEDDTAADSSSAGSEKPWKRKK